MKDAIAFLNREIEILEANKAVFEKARRMDEAYCAAHQIESLRAAVVVLQGGARWTARKIGGSFQHTGTVLAEFETLAGETRLVLEFDPPVAGMLHIYRPDQIEGIF